jgi:hypothetical protein
MDRKLINYLPPVLREVLDFKAINGACEPEISGAWDALGRVLANQFLDTADESGVRVWEKELQIYPKDTDTMEVRKARIRALWNMELPYTVPWLKNWLTSICGPQGHEETIADYTINIQLDYTVLPDADNLAAEILSMLLKVRPSNMRVLMTAFLQSYGTISTGACAELSTYTEVWPLIVNNLESSAEVAVEAAVETSNHTDVWPIIINSLESSGGSVLAGVLEYHRTVEINPNEQEE